MQHTATPHELRLVRAARLPAWGLAGTLALAGCASQALPDDLAASIDAAAAGLPPIADDDHVARVGDRLVAGELPPAEPVEVPPGAGPEDYVRLALERNPGLRLRVRELEALGQRARQADALDDPMLELSPPTGRMIETAGGEMGAAIGVSQALPWPGKRAARGEVAAGLVRAALEDLRAERDRVGSETRDAYAAYYLATVSIDVTTENLSILQRLREVAEARYAAGTAPQQDLLRAEVETYDVANRLITLETERRAAVARLNALIDRDVLASLPPPAALSPRRLELSLGELLTRAEAQNPELAALRAQGGADLAAVKLARLARYPDLNLGAMWTWISSGGLSPVANGADALSLGLGLNLPVWTDRIDASILEHNAALLAAVERYHGARREVQLAVVDAATRVDAAARSALLLGEGILPRAPQTVEVAESGYRSGQVDFLTLLSSWQRLLDLNLSYHAALATLEREVGALERVLGSALAAPGEEGAGS